MKRWFRLKKTATANPGAVDSQLVEVDDRSPPVTATGDVVVVGESLWHHGLEQELGDGSRLGTDGDPEVVVVVSDQVSSVVAERDAYPHALILAVVPLGRREGGAEVAVAMLEAGVDACLVAPAPSEVAAQIDALVRRRRLENGSRGTVVVS